MDPFSFTPSDLDATLMIQSIHEPIVIDQVVVDSRGVNAKSCLFVALKGKKTDGHAYLSDAASKGARYALVQKGFTPPTSLPSSLTLLYVEEPLRGLQKIATLYRKKINPKLIAVTGSRGKTLMKDLLVHLLSSLGNGVYGSPESFNSQVGVALSLLRLRKEHHLAVIEAGISEEGEMAHLSKMLQPDMALLLNLFPAAGSSLENLSLLAQEKMQLLLEVAETGAVFLPCLDCLQPYHAVLRAQRYEWEKSADIHVQPMEQTSLYQVTLPLVPPCNVQLPAAYLATLLKQALLVAHRLGVSSEVLAERLKLYTPESMQTHIWRTAQGITLINSPYCADPQSIASALNPLKQAPPGAKRFFFLHGVRPPYDLNATLAYLKQAIEKKELDTLVLCGLEADLKEAREAFVHVKNEAEGLEFLAKTARHSDHIACKGSRQLSLETLMQAFQDQTPYNCCLIDLGRIAHNITLLKRKLAPGGQMMVMVKALAYGTEAFRMAHFLAQCGIHFLGVSYVDEAIALKRAGVTQEIFSLYVAPQEAEKAVYWGLHLGVDSVEIIEALQQTSFLQDRKTKVHLHIDTGMCRLGCAPSDAFVLIEKIHSSSHLILEGIFTHFAASDLQEHDLFTEEQFHTANSIYQTLVKQGKAPPYLHLGNSAALLRLPHLVGNMARIGLALYGLSNESSQLLQALSLRSQIIALQKRKKGESIGYGREFVVQRDSLIAVVPLGYFDGISRRWGAGISLLVRKARAPIVGSICMDYLMIDVTHIPDVQVGDSVLVFGEDGHGSSQSLQQLAKEGGEIVHALLTQIGPRVPRIFLWNEA